MIRPPPSLARALPTRIAPRSAARIVGLALALGPGLGAQPLHAQSAPSPDPFEGAPVGPLLRDDVAGSRRIPGYVPQGLDLGGVHLVPVATLRGEGSTNVFNRAAGARGDVHAEFAPALLASGSVGRATWVLDTRASLARYARLKAYNSETWAVRAQSGLPVTATVGLATIAMSLTYWVMVVRLSRTDARAILGLVRTAAPPVLSVAAVLSLLEWGLPEWALPPLAPQLGGHPGSGAAILLRLAAAGLAFTIAVYCVRHRMLAAIGSLGHLPAAGPPAVTPALDTARALISGRRQAMFLDEAHRK